MAKDKGRECTRCRRVGLLTLSFSTPGSKQTPDLCTSCFQEVVREVSARARRRLKEDETDGEES